MFDIDYAENILDGEVNDEDFDVLDILEEYGY